MDDDLDLSDLDDIDEVSTKLDLAKAYLDMGDADGTRSILDEVLSEGDDEQKKEAEELLRQLG
jgi:pilus assembly protein FimV